jgi:hypothetical protein
MPFHEQLPIYFRRVFQIDIQHAWSNRRIQNRFPRLSLQRLPLMPAAFAQKWKSGNISRQPNPRRDDNLAHRPASAKPFPSLVG